MKNYLSDIPGGKSRPSCTFISDKDSGRDISFLFDY